jgi:hypothetical protein
MRVREIAVLVAAAVLCWRSGGSERLGDRFASTSFSPIGLELAQNGSVARGYSTQPGSIHGGRGQANTFYGIGGESGEGSAACSGKSAGDACSFSGFNGESGSGTCIALENELRCVVIGYSVRQPGSQPGAAR